MRAVALKLTGNYRELIQIKWTGQGVQRAQQAPGESLGWGVAAVLPQGARLTHMSGP